jgi:3-dehydroquinate dehydratase/shikimate dehydrogenase
VDEDLVTRLKEMRHAGDEISKVAVTPQNMGDVLRLYQAAAETMDFDKIIVGMGHFGVNTRILAEKMGSFLTYASAVSSSMETPREGSTKKPMEDLHLPGAAPGQLNPRDLGELYRFRDISAKTKVYGVLGYPLKATSSPMFFNRVFSEEHIDAVYVPFPADSLQTFLELAELLQIQGVSITVPYKEEILPHLLTKSDKVISVGACNTAVASANGWMGYNTDMQGFSDSLLNFIGKHTLRGRRVAIIGAGGAARAVAGEVFRLKGKGLILNRTTVRAKRLAQPYRFEWGPLDSGGIEMMDRYGDIIIQTTSVGMEPNIEGDPLPDYKFSGSELVRNGYGESGAKRDEGPGGAERGRGPGKKRHEAGAWHRFHRHSRGEAYRRPDGGGKTAGYPGSAHQLSDHP